MVIRITSLVIFCQTSCKNHILYKLKFYLNTGTGIDKQGSQTLTTTITVAASEVHPPTVWVKLTVYVPAVALVRLLLAVVPDIDPEPNVAAVEFTDQTAVAPDKIVAVNDDEAPVQTGLGLAANKVGKPGVAVTVTVTGTPALLHVPFEHAA